MDQDVEKGNKIDDEEAGRHRRYEV